MIQKYFNCKIFVLILAILITFSNAKGKGGDTTIPSGSGKGGKAANAS